MIIYAEDLIKNQIKNQISRYSADGETNVARRKSAQPGGKGFIDENGSVRG
jgi:hypothetical protein